MNEIQTPKSPLLQQTILNQQANNNAPVQKVDMTQKPDEVAISKNVDENAKNVINNKQNNKKLLKFAGIGAVALATIGTIAFFATGKNTELHAKKLAKTVQTEASEIQKQIPEIQQKGEEIRAYAQKQADYIQNLFDNGGKEGEKILGEITEGEEVGVSYMTEILENGTTRKSTFFDGFLGSFEERKKDSSKYDLYTMLYDRLDEKYSPFIGGALKGIEALKDGTTKIDNMHCFSGFNEENYACTLINGLEVKGVSLEESVDENFTDNCGLKINEGFNFFDKEHIENYYKEYSATQNGELINENTLKEYSFDKNGKLKSFEKNHSHQGKAKEKIDEAINFEDGKLKDYKKDYSYDEKEIEPKEEDELVEIEEIESAKWHLEFDKDGKVKLKEKNKNSTNAI